MSRGQAAERSGMKSCVVVARWGHWEGEIGFWAWEV